MSKSKVLKVLCRRQLRKTRRLARLTPYLAAPRVLLKTGLFVDDARGIVHRIPMPTKDASDFDFDPQNMPKGTLVLVDLLYAAVGHTSSVEEMECENDDMSNLLSLARGVEQTRQNPLKALARSIAAVEGLGMHLYGSIKAVAPAIAVAQRATTPLITSRCAELNCLD